MKEKEVGMEQPGSRSVYAQGMTIPIYANAQAHNIKLKTSAQNLHRTGTGQRNGGATVGTKVGTEKSTPGSLLGQPGQFIDVKIDVLNLVISIKSRSYSKIYRRTPYLCESMVLVGRFLRTKGTRSLL